MVDIKEVNWLGESLLHVAKEEKSMEFLLSEGIAVNVRGPGGMQPIHDAAAK